MFGRLSVCPLCIPGNGWTDFDGMFCMSLSGSRNDSDLQLDPVVPTRGGAQTGLSRFTMEIFVYINGCYRYYRRIIILRPTRGHYRSTKTRSLPAGVFDVQ